MPPESLKCKECKTRLSARRALRLRALLRPARGRLRARAGVDADALRRRIQAGPHTIWRYRDFLPLEGAAAARTDAAGRLHAAAARRPARRAPRPARAVGQERRREPDALVQGPRRRGRARRARSELGFEVARVRLDRQPRQRRRRPRGRRRARVLRLHPGRPRGAEDPRAPASTARTLVAVTRQLRRRQPSLHRGLRRARDWAFVNINMRPVLRRGLEDARVRDRRAARLAGARPHRRADRVRLAVHEDRARASRSGSSSGSSSGAVPTMNGAQAERLLAGRDRVRGRARRLPPGQAGHDRQVARDRQPGRRPVRARARAPHRRRRSTPSPTTRSGPASSCSPRRRASSPRRPAASRPRCSRSSPSAATSTPDERVVRRHHRRGPEDARRRARDVRDATRSTPSLRRLRGARRASAVAA